MLGFRGASRYYSPRYREGFALECRAIRRLREEMGLRNVVVMIPFCRSIKEADRVLAVMAENGLKRGENGLEVYVMCEIPSNVILAKAFAERFDGFSIGSNDLTQLTLGVDRDFAELAELFDEQDEAVKWMIRQRHRGGARERRQGRPVRPGAERSSGVRRIPRRVRHRFDLRQPGQLHRGEAAGRCSGGSARRFDVMTARIRSSEVKRASSPSPTRLSLCIEFVRNEDVADSPRRSVSGPHADFV